MVGDGDGVWEAVVLCICYWDQCVCVANNTPTKTNMKPENDGSQKESPLPRVRFQVPC